MEQVDIDAKRAEFIAQASKAQIPHFMHASLAHQSAALRRLVRKHGMAAYGRYWLLVELLMSSPEHSYDVSDSIGWEMLADDLGRLERIDPADACEFIEELAALGLISREHLDECSKVVSLDVLADVEKYAYATAKKKLGAWIGAMKKIEQKTS